VLALRACKRIFSARNIQPHRTTTRAVKEQTSSDQWHLITEHGPLDVMTLPAQSDRSPTCAPVLTRSRWAV
jgi:hypothetical protein